MKSLILCSTLLAVAALSSCSPGVTDASDVAPQASWIPCIDIARVNRQNQPLFVIRTQAEYQSLEQSMKVTNQR